MRQKIAVFFCGLATFLMCDEVEARRVPKQHTAQSVTRTHLLLQGSPEILRRQNEIADHEGLERFADETALAWAKVRGELFVLPDDTYINIEDDDKRFPYEFRWCRWWTRMFLKDTGAAHFEKFKKRIVVTSAVRTHEYQKELRKGNANAGNVAGNRASLHLTGAAVDITKKGMTLEQIRWMRNYLVSLEEKGVIDATEEFHQAVFHIFVLRRYDPEEPQN